MSEIQTVDGVFMFERLSVFYVSCIKWFALVASTLFFCLAVAAVINAVTLPEHSKWDAKSWASEVDVSKVSEIPRNRYDENFDKSCGRARIEQFKAPVSLNKKFNDNFIKGIEKTPHKSDEDYTNLIACDVLVAMDMGISSAELDDWMNYSLFAMSRVSGAYNPFNFSLYMAENYVRQKELWRSEQRDFSINYYGIGVAFGLFVSFVLMGALLILVRIECNTRK